jgi:DNA-directed RNA polymerase specialized sigma24 family protein
MAHTSDEWSAWLDEHGPALVLLARQWVPTQADAEDVVQEAFVRGWRSRNTCMPAFGAVPSIGSAGTAAGNAVNRW